MKKIAFAAVLLNLAIYSAQAANYTYIGANGGSWSTTTNWSPTSGSGGPGLTSGDTVTINDPGTNQTVVYDTGANAGATFGGLTLNEGTVGATNELDIQKPTLTITPAYTLGATAGTALLYIDSQSTTGSGNSSIVTFTNGLTINSGGQVDMHGFVNVADNNAAEINGAVTLSGGTINIEQSSHTSGDTQGSASNLINNTFTMNSGNLNFSTPILTTPPGGTVALTDNRLNINGNFTMNGGTIAIATGTGNSGSIFLFGTTNVISGSSVVPTTGLQITLNKNNTTQTLTSNQALPTINIRYNASGTSIGELISGNSGSALFVHDITLAQQTTGATTEFLLGSDVTTTSGTVATNGVGGVNGATSSIINTNAHTLDLSISGTGLVLTNATTGTNSASNWSLLGDGTTNGNVIKAQLFDLSPAKGGATVGANVTLDVVGTSTVTTNLGNTFGGTIDPTSTFVYQGTATSSAPASLTSNRSIGALKVASGYLKLAAGTSGMTNLNTGGNTTVSAGATLDLNAKTLTLLTTSNLQGGGTITNTGGGASSISFGTGGLQPNTALNTTPLQLTLNTVSVTLNSGSNSLFNINSGSSFDSMVVGTGASIAFNGTLTLDFNNSFTPTAGNTFALFTGAGLASDTGNFTTITSNLTGDTFSFNATSGLVTVTAVPEPATWVLLLGSVLLLLVAQRRQRKLNS